MNLAHVERCFQQWQEGEQEGEAILWVIRRQTAAERYVIDATVDWKQLSETIPKLQRPLLMPGQTMKVSVPEDEELLGPGHISCNVGETIDLRYGLTCVADGEEQSPEEGEAVYGSWIEDPDPAPS